jgi:hypothetical protein
VHGHVGVVFVFVISLKKKGLAAGLQQAHLENKRTADMQHAG